MDAARFDALHREHEELLGDVARLEQAITGDPSLGSAEFGRAVGEFLRRYDARIRPHLEAEATEVYPLLERYLPPETASSESLQCEQDTLRGLIGTLRRQRRSSDEDAFSETLTAATDIVFLLRDLIRKEDQVIHPLLRQLLPGDGA